METPLKEQENLLKSCREPCSSTSEEGVQTQELDAEEEEILSQLYRPLETCCNKCFCKKCCYHCQLCFLKKGLGICYEPERTRRRRAKKKIKTDSFPSSN
ncbi:truncated tat protein [Simian immunodeficiency virus]|uniref:Protein Tat n=1 Tax=Simian immunodeficiency virus TaxID=11723 RepID=K4MLN3_SIV|nr:truncated tat protein [Simian immunodeficiency virus]